MKWYAKLTWGIVFGVLIACCVTLITGCSDPHKNQHCVAWHRELSYISSQRIGSITIHTPVYENVCSQWVANNQADTPPHYWP